MTVRMALTGGCAAAVVLMSATSVGISASGNRARATQMFSHKQFSRAIDRLTDHAGRTVKLLDVALSETTADFVYRTNGHQVNFKVAVPGRRVAKGQSFVAGGHPFGLSMVHTGVPQGLIAQIRKRPGLRRFVPEIIDLGVVSGRDPEWQVVGKTDSMWLMFTANSIGHRLRQTCAQPLTKSSQPIGC